MPELPEVEVLKRQLRPEIEERTIIDSWGHPSAKFAAAGDTTGAYIESLRRRGKYLIAELEDGRDMIVHLGMTGRLHHEPGKTAEAHREEMRDPHIRAWWRLPCGVVLYMHDVRRFGRVAVCDRGDYAELPTLAAMGPEPFDPEFDPGAFWRATQRSSLRIKTQLLNQRLIAGVGNIYADEALFLSGINPAARAISRPRAERLLEALREVMEASISRGGSTLRDYYNLDGAGSNQEHFVCYGRAGEPCVRCGAELRRRVLDGRSSTWCPACQRR